MAYDLPSLIREIKTFEPRLLCMFSEDFGSARPEHRKKIRASINDGLGALSEPERGKLLDLDEVPDLEEWSISISHCATLGGWIATPLPLRVGLDIEIKARIHQKLIQRIAVENELNGIPDPSFLWCAKESYFKAQAEDQPVAVTQLRIANWERGPQQSWKFSGENMRGALFSHVDLLVSVSLVSR